MSTPARRNGSRYARATPRRDVVLGPALLGQRHEQRAGLAEHLGPWRERLDRALVRPAGHGGARADHADPAARADLDRAARPGLDHADDGERRLGAQRVERHGRRGVAGDDDHLDPLALEEARASSE